MKRRRWVILAASGAALAAVGPISVDLQTTTASAAVNEDASDLSAQFRDVTASSFPQPEKTSDVGQWERWLDIDGDGLVDTRPSFSVAWADIDNDGYVDLWLNNHFGNGQGPPPSLYVNQGDGTFADEPQRIQSADGVIVRGDRHGAVWADFDNDGDQDLLQLVGLSSASPDSTNKLLINEDGRLVDKATELGVNYAEARAREATVFDFNNDGLLDFFHGAQIDITRGPSLPPTLFQQNPDGTFENNGGALDLDYDRSSGIQNVVIADLTGDGRLELLHKQPNTVYQISSGTLVNVTDSLFAGPGLQSTTDFDSGLIDLAIADFNGDLVPDVFLPTTSANNEHRLLMSSRSGFVEESESSGVRSASYRSTQGGGVAVGDFDNDMDQDLFLLNHATVGPDFFLENRGDGTFSATPFLATDTTQTLPRSDLRTTAVADYNNDGFLDILETTSDNAPTYRLFENTGNDNNWLLIELEGTVSNRDGVGATVYVTAGDTTQMRQQTQGQHHRAQDDKRLHFGLGDASQITEIRIVWPSGIEQTLESEALTMNQIVRIEETGNSIDRSEVRNDHTFGLMEKGPAQRASHPMSAGP